VVPQDLDSAARSSRSTLTSQGAERRWIGANHVRSPALEGLADFSHLIVTWWADRADELAGHGPLVAEPTPYVEGPTRAGVFATRSPLRPTPIGLSVAGIISVDDTAGEIELGWIDALDNTPVVDIKPYFPSSDRVRDATVPSWCATWPNCLEDSSAFDWAAVLREG